MSGSDGEGEAAQFSSAKGSDGDAIAASANRARRLMLGQGLGRGKSTARRAMEDWIAAPTAIDDQKGTSGRGSGRSGRSTGSGGGEGEGGEGGGDKEQENNKPNRAFFALNRDAAQSYNNLQRRLWILAQERQSYMSENTMMRKRFINLQKRKGRQLERLSQSMNLDQFRNRSVESIANSQRQILLLKINILERRIAEHYNLHVEYGGTDFCKVRPSRMADNIISLGGNTNGLFGTPIPEISQSRPDGYEIPNPGHVSFGGATIAGHGGGPGSGPMGGPEHPEAGTHNLHVDDSQHGVDLPVHNGGLSELLSTYDRLKSRFRLCSYLTDLLASYKSLTHLLTRLQYDSLALQRVKPMQFDIANDQPLPSQPFPSEDERVLVISRQPTAGAATPSAVLDGQADGFGLPALERSQTQPEPADPHIVSKFGNRSTISGKTLAFQRAHTGSISMNVGFYRDRSNANANFQRDRSNAGGLDVRNVTRSPIEDPRLERLRNTLVPTYRLQRLTRAFTEPTLSAIFKREAPRSRPSSRRPRRDGESNVQSRGPSRGPTPAAAGSRPSTAHVGSKRSSAVKE